MTTTPEKYVLVLEDDADIRFAISALLEQVGIKARTAQNGKDGLEIIENFFPSLIFLDMRMPVMDGWEFAKQFRGRYGHAVPIVVLTAAANARKWATEISAEGYLPKPFSIGQMLSVLGKFGIPGENG